ncbi:patatin-like phospholipase family protein [Candidatus Gracilibacteria bacterium]|nr:patatin-like phospholipase family protein [Candidatus Gracilibacteria bacterium]NJM88701.1 patatin-like phospholipase family protein [Hydrococcus sp. RU_2_2]
MKTRIAIACQGGGGQAAFTAGALKALFENNIQDKFEIVSLSGTSGGAICAALTWYALKKGDNPVWQRLMDFWTDNTAQTYQERIFNDFAIKTLELVSKGILPQFNISPSSPQFTRWMSFATVGLRSRFTNFQELLEAHIDFQELAAWGVQPNPPILLLGACNILTGKLWKFNSSHEPMKVEHILASCAIPNIFGAVEIGKDAYWDGIFSDNPPTDELIKPYYVGIENIPQEIWVIKLNPTRRDTIPVEVDDILDRRNELEGNISLFQNLINIETINDLFLQGAFKDEFLEQFYCKEPIKIPKSFAEKEDKPYYIPFIEMSEDLQKSLNYESKLDRNPENIKRLIEDGEKQGKKFLEARLS